MEEELSDGKVNITCESNRVLESLTCSVDNDPPQSCTYVANKVNLYSKNTANEVHCISCTYRYLGSGV